MTPQSAGLYAVDAKVRRFACFTGEDGVYEHANGEHVAYADYALLAAENARLKEDVRRLSQRRLLDT